MSAAMDSSTDAQQVFVELLGEGTVCLRPTLAQPLGAGTYRLLATSDYDPKSEQWEFPPGTTVRCREEHWGGRMVLVAREAVDT